MTEMFNRFEGFQIDTIMLQLRRQVNQLFSFVLRKEISEEESPFDLNFKYSWASREGQEESMMTFTKRPVKLTLTNTGILSTYDVQMNESDHWLCENDVIPTIPSDPK